MITHQYLFTGDILDQAPARWQSRGAGALGAAMKPNFWYFETLETVRKLLLSGALLIFSDESSVRSLLGMLVCLLHLSFLLKCEPYREKQNNVLSAASSAALLIDLCAGTAIRANQW